MTRGGSRISSVDEKHICEAMESNEPIDQDYVEEDEDYIENDEFTENLLENEGDSELLQMQRRIQEMEEEQEKVSAIQKQVEKQISSASENLDESSVYVFLTQDVFDKLKYIPINIIGMLARLITKPLQRN